MCESARQNFPSNPIKKLARVNQSVVVAAAAAALVCESFARKSRSTISRVARGSAPVIDCSLPAFLPRVRSFCILHSFASCPPFPATSHSTRDTNRKVTLIERRRRRLENDYRSPSARDVHSIMEKENARASPYTIPVSDPSIRVFFLPATLFYFRHGCERIVELKGRNFCDCECSYT